MRPPNAPADHVDADHNFDPSMIERAVRDAEARLAGIVESAMDAIITIDGDHHIVLFNKAAEEMFGYSADEVLGTGLDRLIPPRFREAHRGHIEDFSRTGVSTRLMHGARTVAALRKDGSEFPAEASISQIDTKGGKLYTVIMRDVSARVRFERALEESNERYQLLFAANPMPMWVFDIESLRFLEVNQAAIEHYGYSHDEFMEMTIRDIRPPEDLDPFLEHIATIPNRRVANDLWRHVKKDGTVIFVELAAHSIEFAGRSARLIMANDVTERTRLEEQLRQSQKMEAVGLLAGGIAHDFNNLLTAINGYSELALRDVSDNEPLAHKLREIRTAGERAAALTRQLLAFSRKQLLQPVNLNLNSVVVDLQKMLRRLITEDIDLVYKISDDLGAVRADPGQIEQVIMNLVINARDAMPRGGKLLIETENVYFDQEYVRTHLAATEGPFVKLAVTDAGVGMDEATRSRIFEPFFTTKEAGKGTGLGLSTVYGIVKQSGGFIWVYSELGEGTTFKIYLPRVDVDAAEGLPRRHVVSDPSGTETILIAEDEELVREMTRTVLETYGYQVLEAANGGAALMVLENHPGRIDLLLTDVIMPEISGRELAERGQTIRPEIKILFMSGYTDNSIVHRGVIDEGMHFLQKPFSTEALATKLREVLDEAEN